MKYRFAVLFVWLLIGAGFFYWGNSLKMFLLFSVALYLRSLVPEHILTAWELGWVGVTEFKKVVLAIYYGLLLLFLLWQPRAFYSAQGSLLVALIAIAPMAYGNLKVDLWFVITGKTNNSR